MDSQFLTPGEVADLLQLKMGTVYAMIRRGDIRASRMGKQLRIAEADVYAYMGIRTDREEPVEITICGQDVILDILCACFNRVGKQGKATALRCPLGSYNALRAMYIHEDYVVAVHLWDSGTDTYNIPYISKLMPGENVAVFHLARRIQGMYVQEGNPKQIVTLDDLACEDVTVLHREKGSGTRIFMDAMLLQRGIRPRQAAEREKTAFSHMEAAARVARGEADVSFGVEYAARHVPGVGFIPLKRESYDLVMRLDDLERPPYAELLDIIRSPEFRGEIQALHGYDVKCMGDRIY